MARNVRISALGLAPLEVADKQDCKRIYEEEQAYLEHWIIKVLADRPDLIILPEACDRPLGLTAEQKRRYYDFRGNQMRDHICELAARHRVCIVYSAGLAQEDGTLRNSAVFIDDNGTIRGIYNKNHLVIEERTEQGALYGKDAPIIEMPFGRTAGVICFDLNFDELREKYVQSRPELIVFCSMYHGGLVQRNWAYTCRSWFAGCIAGQQCTVINPVGDVVAASTNYYPYVTCDINLDYAVVHLDHNWERLDALRTKYGRNVSVYDPGYLGAVLVTSEHDDVSAAEMIREFEIELLDDYLERSLADRHAPGNIEP